MGWGGPWGPGHPGYGYYGAGYYGAGYGAGYYGAGYPPPAAAPPPPPAVAVAVAAPAIVYTSSGGWYCPKCRQLNPRGTDTCARCFHHIYEGTPRAAAAAPVVAAQWACQTCQHVNNSVNAVCVKCRNPRVTQAPAGAGGSAQWVCKACSRINNTSLANCAECTRPREWIQTARTSRATTRAPSAAPTPMQAGPSNPPPRYSWTCTKCNNENVSTSSLCARCGVREDATPTAP